MDTIVIQNNTLTKKFVCKLHFLCILIITFVFYDNIEKDLWESDDFKIIIGVAVIAIFFIIILISCLLYLRVQGEKMSKVERLTQVHQSYPAGDGGGMQNQFGSTGFSV